VAIAAGVIGSSWWVRTVKVQMGAAEIFSVSRVEAAMNIVVLVGAALFS